MTEMDFKAKSTLLKRDIQDLNSAILEFKVKRSDCLFTNRINCQLNNISLFIYFNSI